MIKNLDFWYDGQQRRFLEQVVRAFSGFQYQTGSRNGQPPQLVSVPCRMASTDRLVGSIMRNNSENTLNSTPMITIAQTGISGRRDAVQYPGFIDTLQVVERAIGPDGKYGAKKGEAYTVKRLMPRPFDMMLQVDIWTSNLDQKHQLAEQILTIIYPTFDIQNSDNGLDWTALSMIMVEDITWSSRSVPVGTESEIDIMTIQLRLPIWLSPPAMVKHQKIIEQIVTNIRAGDEGDLQDATTDGDLLARDITTPNNYATRVDGNVVTLLTQEGALLDINGEVASWTTLLELYGVFRPGVSEIRFIAGTDPEGASINGVMQLGSTPNEIMWVIDPATLPANTLTAVNAVIDPLKTFPGSGLPASEEGTRYLLLNDIGPSVAWGQQVSAHRDDIIQYTAGVWVVSFQAATVTDQTPQYVLNLHSGRQLHWTGDEWVMAIDAEYGPGFWRLSL